MFIGLRFNAYFKFFDAPFQKYYYSLQTAPLLKVKVANSQLVFNFFILKDTSDES